MGTTRQKTDNSNTGKDHLPSGYEGDDVPNDVVFPSCTFEDVDRAVTNLFKSEINFVLPDNNISPSNSQQDPNSAPVEFKVQVRFVAGERFAIVKNTIHDKNGEVRLPLIAIKKTGISQTLEDMNDRGISQHVGEITIKKRLNESDKTYQLLINKLGLKNINSTLSSRRTQGELKNSSFVKQGGLLQPAIGKNIYEITTIPTPQFYIANYEVSIWAQRSKHMNHLVQQIMNAYLMQGKTFKLTTPKGYWFIASLEDDFQSQDNFDNYTDQEILRKVTFSIKVKAYLLVGDSPNAISPVRRYISAPNINFSIEVNDEALQIIDTPREDKSNILTNVFTSSEEQQSTSDESVVGLKIVDNKSKYLKILGTNQKKGETVFYINSSKSLDEIIK